MTGISLADALVGTWRLLDWQARDEDGTIDRPLGPRPEGRLIYCPDGSMSVQMARASRPGSTTTDPFALSAEQADTAYRSYLAYSGRYRLDGDTVTHEVDLSLFPDWVGHGQIRTVDLAGSRLILRTPPSFVIGGRRHFGEVTWMREGA